MKKRKKFSIEDFFLDFNIYVLLIGLLIITLYPVWYVIAASFTGSTELAKNPGILIWPERVVTGAYKLAFENRLIMGGFRNSVVLLIMALPINIVMTLLTGYFMACKNVMFKKVIIMIMLLTMYFSGGLIPSYLNIKSLGIYNTLWALVLPGAVSVYNAIICKTAIEAIPEGLLESAFIDGANDFQVIFKILVPVIKPTLAVLLLYYGVGHWNSWFSASIYLRDETLMPIQNIIRSLTIDNVALSGEALNDGVNSYAETIKYATIVISTLPIMCIYPFLQKYFAKGVMIGAVKG